MTPPPAPRVFNRSRRAIVAAAFVAVAFFSVNMLADNAFRAVKWDATEEGLYTLSESTRQVLGEIDEPVTLRLFFSRLLGERSPAIKAYHARVEALLEQYADIAGGRVHLEYYDPEPFSTVEDSAVAFGLEGFPVTDAGDRGYFGLAGTNATDDVEVIPFLSQDREEFIEYDLTRMVHALSDPARPTLGILSTVPLLGDERSRRPPAAIVDSLREFYELSIVGTDAASIPADVDVLMIVHPHGFSEATLYAIDQYMVAGGRALVFVDPNAEIDIYANPQAPGEPGASDFNRLLNAWGLALADGQVAGDLGTARRVSFDNNGQLVAVDYVGWLSLAPEQFDVSDAVMGELALINVATPGILETVEREGVTVSPLIVTGPRTMRIPAERFGVEPPVVELFNSFEPSGETLTIAARATGAIRSVFDAAPDGAEGEHVAGGSSTASAIVFADVDMLGDRLWVNRRQLLGQTIDIPIANNADFVVNAVDNLGGSSALIGLRGRRSANRPFHLIDSLRQEAELRYSARERDLRAELTRIEGELQSLLDRADAEGQAANEVVISDAEREKIDAFRDQILKTRADLRTVRHELRKDIEAVNDTVRAVNVGLVPALLVAAALIAWIVRQRRRRVRVAQA